MSDIIAKEKIYSKYENIEQTLVHPETQVAQIVDFREGVIDALPEDVVYKGDNISLLNNDAGYINNVEAKDIANTQVAEYTYDKDTIDGKASNLINDIDDLLHEKDNKIQELKDKLDDTYDRLKEYMDANDFLNLAPKIGYYQEDEMQVTSKFNINNMDGRYRMSPVITTDNTGKEVMYFIANNGGPDREENENLHKAYKINETSNWVYYNTMVIPYCLKSEINAGGKIRAILGCDNDYLIVQFRLANNEIKYYLIYTSYSFDENDWKTKIDISQVVISNVTSDNNYANIKPDTSEWVMHIKYIKDYGTIVVFSAISCKWYDEYWYRMRVFDFNKLNTANVNPLIRTKDLEGFSAVVDAGEKYSFSSSSHVTSGLSLTSEQISEVESKYGDNALTSVFNYGDNENYSIAGQVVYLHEQEILAITIYRLQSINMFSVDTNYSRTIVVPDMGSGNFAIIFKVPIALAKTASTSATITLKTTPNSYNFTERFESSAFNELYLINHKYGHNEKKTGMARYLTSRDNNSSYDSYNGRAYYTGYNCSNKKWRYSRLINSEQTQSAKWGGVLTEKDYAESYVTDASDWGKAIMNGGLILWDNVILTCDSAKNNGNVLLWVKKWRFIEGYADSLDIEPIAGEYQIVDPANITQRIRNATSIYSERTINFNDKYKKYDWSPAVSAITSCRMTDKSARYFHAEFIRNSDDTSETSETGHFELYEYSNDTDNEGFKIGYSYNNSGTPNITIDKSDFNLNPETYSSDAKYVRMYNYYCFYNPMADNGNGIFLMCGTLDGGNTSNPAFKYNNFVAVTKTGTVKTMTNPAGVIDVNTTDIDNNNPVTNNWRYFKDIHNAYINNKDYKIFVPTAACCLDKNRIVISYTLYTSSGLGVYLALYKFNDDYTSYSVKRLGNGHAGISHGTGTLYDSMYCRGFLHYSGPKYGLAGLGIVNGDTNYFSTYHNNIRTQFPMSGNVKDDENDLCYNEMTPNANEKEFENEEATFLSGLNTYRNSSKVNIYTVWLQASSGLVCYIPSGPLFLGGYYSVIDTPISVPLSAELRSKNIGKSKTLEIDPSISSSRDGITKMNTIKKTVNVSLNNYDANYIYIKRDPDDRNNIIAYSSPQRIIFDGSRQFNLLLLAKVETDSEKCVKMTYYRVNNGYNDYSFQD